MCVCVRAKMALKRSLNKEENEENNQNESNQDLSDLSNLIKNSDDLILDLDWSTKNEIMNSLIEFQSLLFSKNVIDNDAKQNILKNNNRLITKLISLPSIKSGDEEEVPRKKLKTTSNNHLILEISLKLRTKVIDLLIKNLNHTILCVKASSENTKNKLFEENNKMNHQLLNLLVKPISNSTNPKLLIEEDNQSIDEQLIQDDLPIVKQVFDLKATIDDLKEKVHKAQELIEKLFNEKSIGFLKDLTNSEILFCYELKNVTDFFKSDNILKRDYAYCKAIPFSIKFKSTEKVKGNVAARYLSVHLCCKNLDLKKWPINTEFYFKLLNPIKEEEFKRRKFVYSFQTSNFGKGKSEFISYVELKNGNFIENDTIKLEFYIKIV